MSAGRQRPVAPGDWLNYNAGLQLRRTFLLRADVEVNAFTCEGHSKRPDGPIGLSGTGNPFRVFDNLYTTRDCNGCHRSIAWVSPGQQFLRGPPLRSWFLPPWHAKHDLSTNSDIRRSDTNIEYNRAACMSDTFRPSFGSSNFDMRLLSSVGVGQTGPEVD